jgi:DNA modification methylase
LTKNRPQHGNIYKSDCIEEMSLWPDGCVDCCITDPPYNMSKKKGLGWAFNSSQEDAKNWTFNYEEAKQFNNGKQLRNMWTIPYTPASEKQLGTHPTQKPMTLLTRMVKIWTAPEHMVLDCFLGTGTTAVACEALGRKWVGIEKEADYAQITKRRLASVQKELVLA